MRRQRVNVTIPGGAFLNGLWTAFIGWFLNSAAEQTRQAQEMRESLAGVRVRSRMDPQPLIASPSTSLEEFVDDYVIRRGRRALPVSEDGRLVGLVSITDAREVPRTAWPATNVERVMTRVPLKTVTPETGLDVAMALLAEGDFHQLPVVDGAGRLVGMLSRSDVLRYLHYRDLARAPGGSDLAGDASRA
jgi:CBS domain-containing protein